ncbi:UvrD/REP helicase N-terminal domain-containing protein, partial [Brevibacterium aurantiacum]
MRFTAERLAELTAADPAQAFPPSPAKKVIVEADPAKTTVISQRVVWLVANEFVSAEEILGLTFTRKAVGELGGRIRVLLSRLRHNLGRGQDLSLPGLDNPTVSTYNSYAASLVSEHGVSIGIEPETVLLDDAAAHTIAGNLIDSTPPDEIPGDFSRETMIADVIALAGQMNDHGRDVDDVTDYLEQCLAALVSSKGKPVDPNGRRAKLEAKIRTA